jgi:GNAT superfamily N-acetyltransferase
MSIIAFPSGSLKNAWREHRTVVLPEFQGLGIGVRMSDAAGEIVIAGGGIFFSKTASMRMGEYRNSSSLWKPTSKNQKARPD